MKDINKLTIDMTDGKPSALLVRFSMPLVLGNLFQQFYTFADTLIVGQKLGVHALAALLRAFGNSGAPLRAMTIASFGNVALDLLFVMGLEMGIRGAAYATLLAQAVAALYCIIAFLRIKTAKVTAGNAKWNPRILSEQMKLGIPMGFQNVITAAGGLIVQSVVNGFGILFLAGYTAANKLYGLLEIAASSYGYAISTYTAQNIGAGKKERVRPGLFSALKIGTVTAYTMSLIMVLFGKPILGLFIADTQVEIAEAISIGYRFLCILAVFFPLLYAVYIMRCCIQGMGNSVMPMISSLMQVAMRIFAAVLLTKIIGNTGVFWGEILAWLGALYVLVFAFLRQYRTIS